MDPAFLKTEMLAEMAESQIFVGDLDGALSTIRQGLLLDEHAFSFFLTLCRIAGMGGRVADDSTANEALDLAERTSAEQLAKEKAEGFTRSTCAGNVHWLTWLAGAQAAGGRREKADDTLQAALDLVASGRYDLGGRQIVIDYGYYDIVTTQARIGDIPGALKTLERISGRDLIGSSMRNIAGALAEGGDLSGALAFVARIDEANPRTQALLWIADIQARHGDSVGAKTTLARIELSADGNGRNERAEGLLRIARAEIQRSDRDSAKRTLAESMPFVDEAFLSTDLSLHYVAVGEAYAAVGMVEEAQRIFERMSPNRNSLARMITKAHTVAGNVEVAEAWILTLPSASEQCGAWLGIVDGFVSLS